MKHSWEFVADIFDTAVRLEPVRRKELLDTRCGDDVELRREIEGLLAQDDAAPEYLTPPHVSPPATARIEHVGAVVGEFRILRRLGSGGMGNVFEAEQTQPHRRVALKTLPALAGDRSAQRRFAQEAELLARMNHPSIAQVFAAGVDGDTPYLAMELVEDALPITEFTRRNDLSLRNALVLFRAVCAGVAHGHAKGVVHRDLKPNNVLVDGKGSPKIIDFGIARALETTDGEAVRLTHVGDLIGTLQYMSPEQAEGRIADVDGQSDVHGLGLILFEMLCRERAFDLAGQSFTGALRIVSTHEIPSTRKLAPELPVEIDWILSKALEKDRSRRYASVAELDADVERLLDHRPVLAGPPSRIYEARKFVRRHRIGIAALTAVFATLSIGLWVALSERNKAQRARDDLLGRTRELETETARKDRLLAFQKRMLTAASSEAGGYDVRVTDLLDTARTELASIHEEPPIALELHESLGDAYSSLGRLNEGMAEYLAALSLVPKVPGFPARRVADMERMVLRARSVDTSDPSVGADLRALVQRHAAAFGTLDHETVASRIALATCLRMIGAFAEAESQARAALATCDEALHPEDASWARSELSAVLIDVGDFRNAETLLRAELASRRARLGVEHWQTLSTQNALIGVLITWGNVEDAEPMARFAADVLLRRAGPDHPFTLRAQLNLADVLHACGRNLEAERLDAELRKRFELLAEHGPDRLALLPEFVERLAHWNPNAQAIERITELRTRWTHAGKADAPEAVRASSALGETLLTMGRIAEAEAVLRETIASSEPRLGRDSRVVMQAYQALGGVLLRSNRAVEAVGIFSTNVAIQRHAQGDRHDHTLVSLQLLAHALTESNHLAEAQSPATEVLESRLARFGALHPVTRRVQVVVAELEWASRRYLPAEGRLCEALSVVDGGRGDFHNCQDWTKLAGMRLSLGRQWDALEAFREAYAIVSRIAPPGPTDRIDAALNLASQYRRMKQPLPLPALLEPIEEDCLAQGGPMNPRVRACRNMLLKSYDELGMSEKLAALHKRIADEGGAPIRLPTASAGNAAPR